MAVLRFETMLDTRVAASYVGLLYDHLNASGLDAVACLGGPPPAAQHFVPMSQWQHLLHMAQQADERPALGLRVAAGIGPRHFGVVGYAALACSNLAEALARLERYHASVYDANPVQVFIQPDRVVLSWGTDRGRPGALVDETAIASLVQLARDMTGRFLAVDRVAFVNPAPADLTPYTDFFGGEVLFDQPATEVHLQHEQLQLPLRRSDPALLALLDTQAEHLLAQVAALPAEVEAWRRRLVPLIREARPTLAALADTLHMSARTLQRRLSDQGLSFQQLLDDTRRHLAEGHLAEARLDLAEIALLLGYSEQSAFQRAFKQWTGSTPAQWRRAHRAPRF